MTELSPSRTGEILLQMTRVGRLNDLLDLFGAEIEALQLADGYLLNMLDAPGLNLVSLKLHLMPEFKNLEQTYRGFKNPVSDEFLNGRVFRTRKTLRVGPDNASDTEKYILQNWKVNEIVGVPIVAMDDANAAPIGAIILLKQLGNIPQSKLDSLQDLTTLFFKSLANWLRFSHLEEMHDQATTAVAEHNRLLQFLDEMSSLTSVDKIFELFAAELFRQVPFDIAGFSLVEGDRMPVAKVVSGSPQYTAICDEWARHLACNPYPLDPTASGAVYVLVKDEPLVFKDVQEIMHLPMTEHDAKTIAILKTARTLFISPIRYHKKPIGILALYSLTRPLELTEADMHLLQQLSSFLGTAITNGKIYATSRDQNLEIGRLNSRLQGKVKELDELASTDSLTGLFNYRVFEEEMARRLSESNRASSTNDLSLALIDVDHFKKFNDSYGHAAGNDVLAGVAREIGKLIRQSDMACRYGGEEFVVILPKCNLEGANLLAERIRATVESCKFDTVAGPRSVTISIGCATHNRDEKPEALFARADHALYQAKKNGRNQVANG